MSRKAKRFYKETHVISVKGGYAVTLDARQLKTPGKYPLITTKPIAALIAGGSPANVAPMGKSRQTAKPPIILPNIFPLVDFISTLRLTSVVPIECFAATVLLDPTPCFAPIQIQALYALDYPEKNTRGFASLPILFDSGMRDMP